MPQNIKDKSYKKKFAFQRIVKAFKYGWTGKTDNIINFEWYRDKKKFQKFGNTKFSKIFIKITSFINLILLIYVIYLIICNYL